MFDGPGAEDAVSIPMAEYIAIAGASPSTTTEDVTRGGAIQELYSAEVAAGQLPQSCMDIG